jgi:3-oxoacyl-[acyl-carrier protein] reductase
MDLGLKGRRALVTGASAGLGLATARALAADGVSVVIAARSRERLERTGLPFVVADVSQVDQVDELFDRAESMLGGIDILIANSGGPPAGNFESTALDSYEPALRANLLSTVAMCKRVVPGMTSRKWGRIVAITSYSVREPVPHLILSNTARAGVTAFLKTLAREVAHHGITVNTLQPGLHLTDRLAGLYPDQKSLDAAAKTVPAGTIGDPDDFGHIAAFLCSDHAKYITGASIPVDGGALRGLQ